MKRVKVNTIDNFYAKKNKSPNDSDAGVSNSSVPVSVLDSSPSTSQPANPESYDDRPTSSSNAKTVQPNFDFYDIGQYVNKPVDNDLMVKLFRKTWSPTDKYSTEPQIETSGRKRFMQINWLEQFSWLSYSAYSKGLFCKICVLFEIKDGSGKGAHVKLKSFVSKPYRDWKRALENFRHHASNTYHKEAIIKAQNFLAVRDDLTKGIDFQVDKQLTQNRMEQKQKIGVIIETILLCGHQNIPLRGNKDSGHFMADDTSENDGNFRALLRYRAKGDETLKLSLEGAPKNASYISPQIQNEVIQIIGTYIQQKLVEKIKTSGFYSLLADETTDITGTEQLTLCIRFFDKKECHLKEYFLSYMQLDGTTGEEISASLMTEITRLGLDLKLLRGQGYDGAANMSGKHNGVQAIIKNKYPTAIFVHCASHTLNLCLNSASRVPEIRNMFSMLAEICTFFRSSPKRTNILKKIFNENGKQPKRLSSYCETRWVERHDSVEIFFESIPEIIQALEVLVDNGCKSAFSFHNQVCSFSFILGVAISSLILNLSHSLSRYLQTVNIDIVMAYEQINCIKSKLTHMRENSDYEFKKCFKDIQKLAGNFGITSTLPRRDGTQKYRSNIPTSDAEEYYRTTLFIPYLNEILANITNRFLDHEAIVVSLYSILPCHVVNCNSEDFETIILFYRNDLIGSSRAIMGEISLWINYWQQKRDRPSNPLDAILLCSEHLYPKIFTLLQILVTIPVTTASAERSFSTLRRVKTYLRNSMSNERLSSLALMPAHRNEVIVDDIVDIFLSKKRKINL